MIWLLVIGGLLLIVLGVWGGPVFHQRPDKASRIHKEATVQEAWEILTSPVEYEEEAIKIPEHKPWYLPGQDRRFYRGVVLGAGLGLMVGALVVPFMAPRQTPGEQLAAKPPAASEKPAPTGQKPAPADQKPGAAAQKPAAPAEPKPAPPPAAKPANQTFTVEPGTTTDLIAANLKAAGLIKSEQEFLDLVVAYGADTRLKAGTFVIPTGASVDVVIQKLTE